MIFYKDRFSSRTENDGIRFLTILIAVSANTDLPCKHKTGIPFKIYAPNWLPETLLTQLGYVVPWPKNFLKTKHGSLAHHFYKLLFYLP